MKHNHHDDSFRTAVKPARLRSRHPTAGTEDLDDLRSEAEALESTVHYRPSEMFSDQQRLESSHASERNQRFLNRIQSVWPTPSA